MPKLFKIKENKLKNAEYFRNKKENYINPAIINLIAKLIKYQNILVIDKYISDNNLTKDDETMLKKECIKPNFYCPTVVQKKNREKLQCNSINSK